MGFWSKVYNKGTNALRTVGNVATLGAIDSPADIKAKKQKRRNRKQSKSIARNKRHQANQNSRFDKQLDRIAKQSSKMDTKLQKQDAMIRKDIARVSKAGAEAMGVARKTAKKVKSLEFGVRAVRKSMEKHAKAQRYAVKSIEKALDADERRSAHIANKLRATLQDIPGGQQMSAMLQKALRDKRLDLPEMTSLLSTLTQFAASGMEDLGEEIAENEASIELCEGRLGAHDIRLQGIGTNASALSGLCTQLADFGILSTGETLDDVANGSLFVRGRRFDLVSFLLAMVLVKSSRLHVLTPNQEKQGVSGFLFQESTPATLLSGVRQMPAEGLEADYLVQSGDLYGILFDAEKGMNTVIDSEDADIWAPNTIVYSGGEGRVAPNMSGFVKVLATAGVTTFDRWYTMLVPFFSEKLAGFIGEDGIDVAGS